MPTSLRTVDVNKIELTDLSVTTAAAGASALAYDDSTGGFTFTPVNMNGLTDVDTTGVTNGQTLLYDSGTSNWIVGDSVGGLSAANTETDFVKSTLTYDSASGTFTFDYGNDFTANGVRTNAIVAPAALSLQSNQSMTINAGNGLTMFTIMGDISLQSNLVTARIFPDGDSTRDIGSDTVRYANVYADNLHGSIVYAGNVESAAGSLNLSGFTGFINMQSNVTVEGNILASDADSYNIGASATRFLEAYVGTIDATTANLGTTTMTGQATTVNVLPDGDSTRDIGSDTVRYANVYADNLHGTLNSGNITYSYGTDENFIGTASGSGLDLLLAADSGFIQLINDTTVDGTLTVMQSITAFNNSQINAMLTVTGQSVLSGGAVASGEINVGVTTANEIDTVSANLVLDSATGLTQVDDDLQVTGSLTVTGDLTINGTSTTVNSTTITVDDPVFTLGGDTAPASNDALDKGIEFNWHDGSAAKVGFFGYDESAAKFTFIADATNTSETFAGTAGDVAFGAGSFTTVTASTSLGVGSDWTVALNGANLQFLYQGTVVAQIDSTGQIDAKQDVIADSSAI